MTRVNELLKREIAETLFRVMGDEGYDLSAITVTHVVTNPSLREARVLVSIRGYEKERDRILRALQHHHGRIQEHVHRHVVLKYTPRLSFELDTSVERGDQVLGILAELEKEQERKEPEAIAPGEPEASGERSE